MNIRRRILLTCALVVAVVSSMAFCTTPSYAVGKIHLIIVRSTTEPSLDKAGNIWLERLESSLEFGKREVDGWLDSSFGMYGVFGILEPATNPGGLGRGDVASYNVLEGNDAHPESIMKYCLEVSHKAGSDDAIMVILMSHGQTETGTDGVKRHFFSPVATTRDSLEQGRIGILRETILECLTNEIVNGEKKEKQHRLVALISDSCVSVVEDPGEFAIMPEVKLLRGKAPLPKETPYLKKFLQEARGVVNINSCNVGQTAVLVPCCRDPEFKGSLFVNAFCRFANNGFYFDSELNPDDFYKLLRIEYEREVLAYNTRAHKNCNSTLTQYKGSVNVAPQTISTDVEAYYKDREAKLTGSGEFKVEERDFSYMRYVVVQQSQQ